MTKCAIFLAVILMTCAFSLAQDVTMGPRELNIDRVGGDYNHFSFDEQPNELAITRCEHQCAIESSCVAWNFDPSGLRTCWLKGPNSPPLPSFSLGLTSGIKISSQCIPRP